MKCCCIAHSLQNSNLRSEDLQEMIQIKLEDALDIGCLQALSWLIRGNTALKSSEMIHWVMEVLQQTAMHPMDSVLNRECFQLAWLEAFDCFCVEIKEETLDSIQPDLLKLSTWIDLMWNTSNEMAIKQACFRAYSSLYAVCPSLSSTMMEILRFALRSPAEQLRGRFIAYLLFCSVGNERTGHSFLR